MARNPPASIGDGGSVIGDGASVLDPGRSHAPWSRRARAPQVPSLRPGTRSCVRCGGRARQEEPLQ